MHWKFFVSALCSDMNLWIVALFSTFKNKKWAVWCEETVIDYLFFKYAWLNRMLELFSLLCLNVFSAFFLKEKNEVKLKVLQWWFVAKVCGELSSVLAVWKTKTKQNTKQTNKKRHTSPFSRVPSPPPPEAKTKTKQIPKQNHKTTTTKTEKNLLVRFFYVYEGC